jgi:Domain of unknown function (DUF3127)
MAYELEGTIKVIMDIQTFGSGFTKREFVLTTDSEKYPQDIKMEFVKDKTSLLDNYRPGQRVKVGFDLRGSEHNGRYYVNVLAFRIQPSDGVGGATEAGGESRGAPHFDRPRVTGGGGGGGGGAGGGAGGGGGGGGVGGDRGVRSNERPPRGDRGERGGRPERGPEREEERRPRRQEEFRGGGRRGSEEDDIDF